MVNRYFYRKILIGDIQRYARDKNEQKTVNADDLKKELGNMIFSAIRWCDDLGHGPEECIQLAEQAQEAYQHRAN